MGGQPQETGTSTKTGGQSVTNPPAPQRAGTENDRPATDPKAGQKVDASGAPTLGG